MSTIATITLAQAVRGLIAIIVLLIIATLGLLVTGCFSRSLRPPTSDLRPPTSVIARPAIAFDELTGMYTWIFIARNGICVHTGTKAFADRADLIAHYANVRNAMVQKDSPDHIVRRPEDEGRFRWILNEGLAFSKDVTDPDVSMRLEMSDQGFDSANACRENYRILREAVLETPPHALAETTLPFSI